MKFVNASRARTIFFLRSANDKISARAKLLLSSPSSIFRTQEGSKRLELRIWGCFSTPKFSTHLSTAVPLFALFRPLNFRLKFFCVYHYLTSPIVRKFSSYFFITFGHTRSKWRSYLQCTLRADDYRGALSIAFHYQI